MTTSVDSRPSFDVRSPAATAAGWTGERGLPAALDPRGPRRCRPHRPARQPSSRCAPRRLFGAVRARGAEGRAFAWGERGSGRVSSWRFLDIGLGRHLGRRSRAKAPPGFPLRHAYSNGDIRRCAAGTSSGPGGRRGARRTIFAAAAIVGGVGGTRETVAGGLVVRLLGV